MNSLLLYLAQSSACLLLFYGFFHYVLRQERSFQFNRGYLLLTPLLALTLPLLKIPVVVPEPVADVTWVYALPYEEATVVVVAAEEERLTVAAVLPWLAAGLYLAGVLYFSLRLLRQLSFVRRLLQARQHLARRWQNCLVIPTEGQTPTFSFLRYIFWNDQPPVSEEEKEQILAHERVHVRQRHSLDVLYLAALQIVLWINPLLLLYQKALAETHEYIADEAVVREGSGNVQHYAQLVVRQLFWRLERPIGSFFSSSQTLNRITMLRNNVNPKRWKQLLALPVLALSVALFSFQLSPLLEEGIPAPFLNEVAGEAASAPAESALTSAARTVTGKVTGADTQAGLAGATVIVKGSTRGTATDMAGEFTLEIPENHNTLVITYIGYVTTQVVLDDKSHLEVALEREVRNLDEVRVIGYGAAPGGAAAPASAPAGTHAGPAPGEQRPVFRTGEKDMMDFLAKSIKYPAGANKAGAQGLVVVSFTVDVDGTVSGIEVLKKLDPELDAEAVRVAKGMSGDWKPALRDGKPVATKITLPIRFASQSPAPAADKPFSYVEQMPVFEGGQAEMVKYLGRNLKYPAAARQADTKGMVVVEFVIHKDGSITDAKIARGLSPETDQEALRVVQSMSGKWEAGKQNGAPVDVKFVLPIRFDMESPTSAPSTPSTPTAAEASPENTLRFPAQAKRDGAEGMVFVAFTLHPNGSLSDIEVTKKVHPALDREAVRALKANADQYVSGVKRRDGALPGRYTMVAGFHLSYESAQAANKNNPFPPNVIGTKFVISPVQFQNTGTEVAPTATPQFRGGPEALQRHLREKIKFAAPTAQRPVDGIVTIRLTVNPDGTLSQVKLVDRKFKNIKVVGESSLNYKDPKQFDGGQRQLINDLSQQALEVVRATSGQWTPAEKNGRKLKSTFNVEIPIKYP